MGRGCDDSRSEATLRVASLFRGQQMCRLQLWPGLSRYSGTWRHVNAHSVSFKGQSPCRPFPTISWPIRNWKFIVISHREMYSQAGIAGKVLGTRPALATSPGAKPAVPTDLAWPAGNQEAGSWTAQRGFPAGGPHGRKRFGGGRVQ